MPSRRILQQHTQPLATCETDACTLKYHPLVRPNTLREFTLSKADPPVKLFFPAMSDKHFGTVKELLVTFSNCTGEQTHGTGAGILIVPACR